MTFSKFDTFLAGMIFVLVILVVMLHAQTSVPPGQISPRTDFVRLFAAVKGKIEMIQIDSSLVLDTSTTPATLRAAGGQNYTRADVVFLRQANGTYITGVVPIGALTVYRNGLRQKISLDYSQTSGAAGLTVTPVQPWSDEDVITGDALVRQ